MHGNLRWLGTILSEVSSFIVITGHTCYILLSIVLSLFLPGNTILWWGILRDVWTFLSLLATKRTFPVKLATLGNI